MKSSEDKAIEYAQNTCVQLQQIIAQAYKTGYEQGVLDSTHKLSIDGIDYFDANLPSGTLWSWPPQYENYGWHLRLATYDEVRELGLPTKDQWEELCRFCRIKGKKLIAPNGIDLGYPTCLNSPSNRYITYSLGEDCKKGHNRFWLKSDPDAENMVEVIEFDENVNSFNKHFTGFKLPFFLVKNKNDYEK